ncbi:MAG: glycosyltransferase, partial [Sphingobacteriales bacterium]
MRLQPADPGGYPGVYRHAYAQRKSGTKACADMVMDLVVPFYNPRQDWEFRFVTNIHTLIDEHFGGDRNALQIIIVNDGSTALFTDIETAYLRQHIPGLTIISYPENQGKGYALRAGVAKTKTQYCVYSDNDFPFGLAAIREMYDALQKGADIVAACRTSGNYFRHLP